MAADSGDRVVHGNWAKEDHDQSAQNIRMCLQLIVAANGGASLAMLSALTAIATAKEASTAISIESVQRWFAFAALIFLVGVFVALLSMFFFSVSREKWGHFWEDVVNGREKNYEDPMAKEGAHYARLGFICMCISVLTFLPGALAAVRPFLR